MISIQFAKFISTGASSVSGTSIIHIISQMHTSFRVLCFGKCFWKSAPRESDSISFLLSVQCSLQHLCQFWCWAFQNFLAFPVLITLPQCCWQFHWPKRTGRIHSTLLYPMFSEIAPHSSEDQIRTVAKRWTRLSDVLVLSASSCSRAVTNKLHAIVSWQEWPPCRAWGSWFCKWWESLHTASPNTNIHLRCRSDDKY